MEIDHQIHKFRKTGTIPPDYAHLLLRDHHPEVAQGSFGVLISQWLYAKEYSICVNHFEFYHPTSLKIIVKPCTTFYFAVENSVTIYKGTLFPDRISVNEGDMVKLVFLRSSVWHKVKYKKGTYVSLHITVPEENANILNDESWVWDVLGQYKKIIYKR